MPNLVAPGQMISAYGTTGVLQNVAALDPPLWIWALLTP